MPLPLIIGIGAAIAGAAGVGAGVHGAVKMKDANDTMTLAKLNHEMNIERFEKHNKETNTYMDELGKKELEVLKSFDQFSDLFEQIKNRPVFKSYEKDDVKIPEYNKEELKEVSIGAGILLGGLSGAAVGTAGGFAAAGATTAAVMAFGTASTGALINSLAGAAATNATLAALGGGAIAAGGGGIALGTTVLGAATLGVGLLVGGAIFSFTGSKLSDKADEAWAQMKEAEKTIDGICEYLIELSQVANDYRECISKVDRVYQDHLNKLYDIVVVKQKNDWNYFTNDEKMITENTVLLVNLLYNMGKVKLVLVSENEELNKINKYEINESMKNAETFLKDRLA